MWIVEFTKEIEVEAKDRQEAISKAINIILQSLAEDIDANLIFDVEARNTEAHKVVR